MSRTLVPRNGNDNIATPPALAQLIVDHFRPSGARLDPCCGFESRPFLDAMRALAEGQLHGIDLRLPYVDGRIYTHGDFLAADSSIGPGWDWIVTNPPWSKLLPFLVRSMEVADNIVFLTLLPNYQQKAKRDAIRRSGFGIVEHLHLSEPNDPAWPRTGFALGATWIRRGWTGSAYDNYTHLNT